MKPIKSQRGQSLVEMAVSILLLLFLIVGAVEFGMAFFQFVQLRDAAQEGALYGSISFSTKTGPSADLAKIEQRTRYASGSPIDLTSTSAVTVNVYVDDVLVWQNGSAQNSTSVSCENHALKVELSYDHKIFMPFLSAILGGRQTLPLRATVTDTILSPLCVP
jgi:Flp pilus assembly protein TadG